MKGIKISKPKPANPLEKTRQAKIIKFMNSLPNCIARVRHQTGFNQKGDPDIYGCLDKLHFELEVKRPGEKLTELQALRIKEWQSIGAIAGRVEDIETTRALFAEYGIIL